MHFARNNEKAIPLQVLITEIRFIDNLNRARATSFSSIEILSLSAQFWSSKYSEFNTFFAALKKSPDYESFRNLTKIKDPEQAALSYSRFLLGDNIFSIQPIIRNMNLDLIPFGKPKKRPKLNKK